MSMPSSHLRYLPVAALAFIFTVLRVEAAPVRDNFVEAELITEYESIQPGQDFVVGVRLKIDPTWHTYWINSGESGFPTTIKWELSEGFEAGPMQFP